jgi:hypothetical protein
MNGRRATATPYATDSEWPCRTPVHNYAPPGEARHTHRHIAGVIRPGFGHLRIKPLSRAGLLGR